MPVYLSIGEAATYLGVSEQSLRRWDADGSFKASFVTPGGHRHYSLADLSLRMKGIFQLAREWAVAKDGVEPAPDFYCPTSEIFKTRLERMSVEMEKNPLLIEVSSLVTAVIGEIGNNAFDHNLGNWPDVPGVFFSYNLGKRTVAVSDRGRGLLTTLRAVRPGLADDHEALRTAFTEILTGRAPEHRGNGLKYVRKVLLLQNFELTFQSGMAEVFFGKDAETVYKKANEPVRGCLALLHF